MPADIWLVAPGRPRSISYSVNSPVPHRCRDVQDLVRFRSCGEPSLQIVGSAKAELFLEAHSYTMTVSAVMQAANTRGWRFVTNVGGAVVSILANEH